MYYVLYVLIQIRIVFVLCINTYCVLSDPGVDTMLGLCTLLQAAQGHCPHRYERRTAACGMRARRRGAVLVLQVIIVDTRRLMGCIDFGEPDGRAERCRARGVA